MPAQLVNINGGCPTPNPAPVSKGQNPNDAQLTFQAADNGTYTLTGLDACLNAPNSVTISPGNPAGPYTPLSSASGGYGYTIDPPCDTGDPPEIDVNP